MKYRSQLNWAVVLVLAALGALSQAAGAPAPDEQQLIQILRSSAPLGDKDAACEQLKRVATAQSVPALAALLGDDQLSHSARYVLEAMPLLEAGRALVDALPNSAGATQTGIIGSLGLRREAAAVPALAKLLTSPDEQVAIAAARALGRIADADAVKALEGPALNAGSGSVHAAAMDGLLRCANSLLTSGKTSESLRLCERLYASEKTEAVQVAAYSGMIRASGANGLKLIIRALSGPPGPARIAALQLAREIPGGSATDALAKLLPQIEGPLQIALIQALSQRGDPAAVPALVALTRTASPDVCVALLGALGQLGDASVAPLLAKSAATGTPAQQTAARQALVDLRRGNVADALVGQLAAASPEMQTECARALGQRGDQSAVPQLLSLAEKGSPSTRKAAFKSLGMLLDEPQLPGLIRFVETTADDAARAEAAEALNYSCQRLVAKRGRINVAPLVQAVAHGKRETRIALLPVCSGLVHPEVRAAIRAGVQDPDPQVRAAGVRALCDTMDPELLEDVLTLARVSKEENFRSLAIAAGVRLCIQEESAKLSRAQRLAVLKALLSSAVRPEEKRLVLAGLGELPDPDALRTVEPLLQDPALNGEASRAAVKIALALPAGHAQESIAVLKKGVAGAKEAPTREALESALKQLQASSAFITDWMVAGPYRQEGKDYAALFDFVFPPETDQAKTVDWKPLPAGTDPARPFVMDLLRALGGEQCVAYARTWVHCDKEETARLELGSDDGVKIWVNDKQVFALNTARPLTPGSDKVDLTFRPGWNQLLFKVTQNNLGWEFCARLLKLNGSYHDGLKIEAAPKN
jgi:HEAT repeat protein